MKLKKIIYAKKDKDFKKNGCTHVWSADYPDIKKDIYSFADGLGSIMSINGAVRQIMEEVRERKKELPFKLEIL